MTRLALLPLLLACGPKTSAPRAAPRPAEATEVVVLGTIHSGHLDSPGYSVEVLRELIRAIEPDVVCTEIPPDRLGLALSQYAEDGTIEEPRVARFPEYTDALFPLAAELEFEITACAGWTRVMADARSARMAELEVEQPEAWAEVQAGFAFGEAEIARRGWDADPYGIASDAYDAIVNSAMGPYDRLFSEALGEGGWHSINEAHMALVEQTLADHQGKRVLVTFGAWHKYWFVERLGGREDVRLLTLEEVAPR